MRARSAGLRYSDSEAPAMIARTRRRQRAGEQQEQAMDHREHMKLCNEIVIQITRIARHERDARSPNANPTSIIHVDDAQRELFELLLKLTSPF